MQNIVSLVKIFLSEKSWVFKNIQKRLLFADELMIRILISELHLISDFITPELHL